VDVFARNSGGGGLLLDVAAQAGDLARPFVIVLGVVGGLGDGVGWHAFAKARARFGGKRPRFSTIYPSLWTALGPKVEAATPDYGLA
jgi:hypothetical protein